jgi:hypothetical protein
VRAEDGSVPAAASNAAVAAIDAIHEASSRLRASSVRNVIDALCRIALLASDRRRSPCRVDAGGREVRFPIVRWEGTMKGSISDYLVLRQMPPGRHVFALNQMGPVASELGLVALSAHIDAAIEKGRQALRAEFAWAQARARRTSARGKAVLVDNQADVQISAIETITRARTVGDPGEPLVVQAQEVLDQIFPRGVAPITKQRFEVQLGIMDTMLEHFHGSLSTHVTNLGLERDVARLARLVEEFRAELTVINDPAITFDKVTEARDELHQHTSAVTVLALAAFPGLDEESTRTRERLMAPINDQQARVFEARRRQRRPLDVDPETGQEIEPVGDADDEDPEADE